MDFIKSIISLIYNFLWGDLITIPLPGGSSLGLSLLVIILIPSGIYFTFKTKFVLFRYFPEMIRISTEKKNSSDKNSLSGLQALIINSYACRHGKSCRCCCCNFCRGCRCRILDVGNCDSEFFHRFYCYEPAI